MAQYRAHFRGFGIAAPGANNDAIATVTWPSSRPAWVAVQVATGSVVNLTVTRGASTKTLGLNGNQALTAGTLHTERVFGLEAGDGLNLQVETDSEIDLFGLDEELPDE